MDLQNKNLETSEYFSRQAIRKFALLILAGVIVLVGGISVLISKKDSSSTSARITREGTIRIGYAVEEPFVYFNENGDLTGSEVESAKIILSQLAIPNIEWHQTEFGSLIPDLESGQFDLIVAGMFITLERAQRVQFSEPTFRVRNALLVKSGNPFNIKSYEDFKKNPRFRIALLHGSIEERLVYSLGLRDSQIVIVPDALTGRLAVEYGTTDGLALSSPAVHFMALNRSLGKTEIVIPEAGKNEVTGFGAFVFRKSDRDLLHLWNQELDHFIGSEDHRRIQKSFGFTEDELPGKFKTSEILRGGIR